MGVVLRSVNLADGTTTDFRFAGGLITDRSKHVETQPGDIEYNGAGRLVLPAFVEPHAHLDKALSADRVLNPAGDLWGAIQAWRANYPNLTGTDIEARAEATIRMAVAYGVTLIRTHVDVGEELGLTAIEALIAVKSRVASMCDVQIAVLTPPSLTVAERANHRALTRAALDMGAEVVGGVPHAEEDPVGCIEQSLALAAEFARPIDLHADENLNPHSRDLVTLCERVLVSGFSFGVTASHCVSLGSVDAATQQRTAELAAEANVAVIALPQTNLYLQARGHTTLPPRGLTAIATLRKSGVTVAGGADNVRDPFNLMGRADPCETAALLVMAAHLDPWTAHQMCTIDARRAVGVAPANLTVGDPAELICVAAATVGEFVASGTPDRWTFHRGVRVVTTEVRTEFA